MSEASSHPHVAGAVSEQAGLETWRIWAGLALVGSVALIGTIAFEKWILGTMTQENPQIVWMAPLSLLLVLAIPTVVLTGARRYWPRVVPIPVVIWVLSFLVLLNYALHFTRLSQLAILILAAGAATQATRWLARRLPRFAQFNRRVVPFGYLALIFAGMAVNGAQMWREARMTALLPDPAANSPNVVLLILDTVRAASMSLYGYTRPTTPVLDSIARSAVVFDRAIAPAPWTLPSHASMMTGTWPHEHGATWHTPLDATYRTLAEELASRGYRTGGFVANLTFTAREYGIARGFATYRDFKRSWDEVLVNAPLTATLLNRSQLRRATGWYEPLGRKLAPQVSREFLDFVDATPDRPFFAFLNYMDAHDPYLPPPPFDTLFGPIDVRRNDLMRLWKRSGGRMNKERLSPEEVQGLIAAYDGTIAMLDRQIGMLLDSLRARGILDNTVLIVTSDHGEFFGEHGLFEHAKSPFLEVIHVPLLLWAPGRIEGGRRIAHPVSLRRIPTTVMSLVDTNEEQSVFPANSLLEVELDSLSHEPVVSQLDRDQKGAQEERGENTVAARTMFSLLHGRLHYLRLGPSRERLFDHVADPKELRNLSSDSVFSQQLQRLQSALDSTLGSTTK